MWTARKEQHSVLGGERTKLALAFSMRSSVPPKAKEVANQRPISSLTSFIDFFIPPPQAFAPQREFV